MRQVEAALRKRYGNDDGDLICSGNALRLLKRRLARASLELAQQPVDGGDVARAFVQEHDRSGAQRRERALDDRVGAGVPAPSRGSTSHSTVSRPYAATAASSAALVLPVRRPEAASAARRRPPPAGRPRDARPPATRGRPVVDVRPAVHADLVALVRRTLHDRLVARDQRAEPVKGGIGAWRARTSSSHRSPRPDRRRTSG